ncbi:uncharacterized protein YbjT (DUF2867 family) [Thermocatellispora tengchongensis]|uniref:Uncharacterized protein YbjT (DUF2867 family) n=1 Tax=Thermocatellispora tengchongensis TaxID=1073253 RepID=A0A840NU47_9ACTN|nr:NAD(P)H-binding protein [Thermocatellispora tengchongensis]MBB5130339.1 uncharacterized protein YbjT (DUF2867 family) [Thermocatellispora tengchongensis]
MDTNANTTVVIGGTGKTGRRVVERLRERGLPVRAASRSSQPPFDWQEPATWAGALRGASAAYITYYPDLSFPGAAESIRALAELAVRNGVRRLVLLSGRGEEEAEVSERGVRESGAEWTILRAAWFMQNFDEYYLLGPVLSGTIALPAGDIGEPFLDVEDIADVAVAALTEDGHGGRVYELTGPRLLTFAEAAAEISAASGRQVRYVRIAPEEYTAWLVEQGTPAEEAPLLTGLFTRVLDGRNAHVTDGVHQALGRPARDFADYAKAAAATGVWSAPH